MEYGDLINYTLGDFYSQIGDYKQSYESYKKALNFAIRKNGSTNKSNGKYFEKLADSCAALSNFNEAEEHYLCALDCYDKDSNISLHTIANLLAKLTDNMNQLGRIDEQIIFLKREIEIYESELNQYLSQPFILATRKLIDIYLENQDSYNAYLLLPKIFDHYVKNEDMNTESMANFCLEFAKVCISLQEIDIDYAKKTLFLSKKYFKSVDNKEGLLECYEIETYIYDALKDNSNLIKTFEKILDLYSNIYGPDYIENVRILNNIALILGEEGKEDESKELFEKAIDICVKNDYIGHEYYSVAITGLAGAHIQKAVREEHDQKKKK